MDGQYNVHLLHGNESGPIGHVGGLSLVQAVVDRIQESSQRLEDEGEDGGGGGGGGGGVKVITSVSRVLGCVCVSGL